MPTQTLDKVRAFAEQFRADPAVRALLDRSREAPRVGACTLTAPLSIALADAHPVHLTWPAIGVDVDIIFLVHDGSLDAKIRDRIAAGPAEFVVVPHAADIPAAWHTLDPAVLERARTRCLWQSLAGLGYTPPVLPATSSHTCSAVVIGPDPAARERVSALLTADGITLEHGLSADVVVAVAPAHGWEAQDYPRLESAFAEVGRMVLTAPAPRMACGHAVAVPEEGVPAEVRRQAQLSPLAPLPDAVPASWERCIHRLERHAFVRPALYDALVITTVASAGLMRVLPTSVAMVFGITLGVAQLWRARVRGAPVLGSARERARGAWLRRKIAGQQWG